MDSAVVLLSGGLDSSTTLALAMAEGFVGHALTFAYGQRHAREVDAAQAVATDLGAEDHRIVEIDLGAFGGSALTDPGTEVPLGRSLERMSTDIPSTYVPARNTILLSYALAWSEVLGARAIFIGATAIDFSGYPDCRPEYYRAFEQVARLGTKRGVEGDPVTIHHPLIGMTKAEIVQIAAKLDVPLRLTWSCYLGESEACGLCDSCQLRLRGFQEAGVADPLPYRAYPEWYREASPAPP
ncbi:MAG: 7-cyano-7-deazaguanine synthase QueC [Thermoplasmata archaeon]